MLQSYKRITKKFFTIPIIMSNFFTQTTLSFSLDNSDNIKNDIEKNINNFLKEEKYNEKNKIECLKLIKKQIKNIIDFYEIKQSNETHNIKSWFCRRNGDSYDSTSYEEIPCMTLCELSEERKNELKNSDNYIEQGLYFSRYGKKKLGNIYGYNKKEPYTNNKPYISIADSIMFNKNFNIEDFESIEHYLSLCRFNSDEKNEIYYIDGWKVHMSFYTKYPSLNYEISFDKKYLIQNDFPKHVYHRRRIYRALLTIMNETPIEYLNMHNYEMLAHYERKHDLSIQNNLHMNYQQEQFKKIKNEKLEKQDYLIQINNLITIEEITDIILNQINYYENSDKENIENQIKNIIKNECLTEFNKEIVEINNIVSIDDIIGRLTYMIENRIPVNEFDSRKNISIVKNNKKNSQILNLQKIHEKYDFIDIKLIIDRLNYMKEHRIFIDVDIDKETFITELYKRTKQYGMGVLNSKNLLKEKDFEEIKTNHYYVSYLNGVPFKTNFNTFPIIDFKKYDSYHGNGTFKKVFEEIRFKYI